MYGLDESYYLFKWALNYHRSINDQINSMLYEHGHNKMTRFIREKDGTYKIEEEIEIIYPRTN